MDIGPFFVSHWLETTGLGVGYHKETFEEVDIKTQNFSPTLAREAETLQGLSGGIGIPTLYWFGTALNQKVMITDALGPSLEDIFHKSNRFLDMSLLLEIAGQLIFRLEWVHSHHVSHGLLTPYSFAMGSSTWQTPQVILADFTNLDGSENSTQKDLRAVGDILLYLAMGCSSWEIFQSQKPSLADAPATLAGYISMISEYDYNPADYIKLRKYFHDARRSLPGRAILGALGPPEKNVLTLKSLASRPTGHLFELLDSHLSTVGERVGDPQIPWGEDQAKFIMTSLNDMMAIYLVLLLRDKPSLKRRRYLMGAYHLPNKLWRDLRWYLCMARCGSLPLRRLLTLNIYKYMGVLLEVVPIYNRHWTKALSDIAHVQMELDTQCLPLWRHAWIHWKNCANLLAKK